MILIKYLIVISSLTTLINYKSIINQLLLNE